MQVHVQPAEAHKSRWGYHPCSYETFLLLKRLARHYRKAVHGYAVWQRWKRKAPQNRLLRRTVRDEKGNKVGSEIVGPRPEPPLCAVFTKREMVKVSFDAEGNYHRDGVVVERVDLCDPFDIVGQYENARYPKPTPDTVHPLSATLAWVRESLATLER